MPNNNDPNASLSDQATFQGQAEPKIDDLETRSLGDQATFAGAGGDNDYLDDGMEIVDLAARYKIEKTLGKGGMGEVLLATDTRLNRKVAIKRILIESSRSSTAINRFLTEAKSIAALNHPNIVHIYDYGRSAEGPFLIMEYVEGGNLLDRCRNGAIPIEEAIHLACQLCEGLGRAHERGIIHRDIKPANILLTADGIPKLTDFGLAKAETADTGMTMAGAVLGTLDFMPPEQRRDASLVDARSDLWSLAATLYQMVTGESPKVIRIKKVPTALQDVLDKALEESKELRYQSASEMQQALDRCRKTKSLVPPQSPADLGMGECPSCHTLNEPHRKFCRECGDSLRCSCLKCEHEIPVWDKVCPECGGKQPELIAARLREIEEQLLSAELSRKEHQYQVAMDIAQGVVAIEDRRLNQHRTWAVEFMASTQAEWDKQLAFANRQWEEAEKLHASFDYGGAIDRLNSIPQPLRENHVASFLQQLRRKQEQSQALLETIESRVKAQSFDDLPPLVEQAIGLCGEREDLISLREELAYREKKRQIEELVFRAEQARKDHDYQSALGTTQSVLAKVDDRFSEFETWALEFQTSTRADWTLAKRQWEEAERLQAAFDYGEAIDALESIPAQLREKRVASFLQQLRTKQEQSQSLLNTIASRVKSQSFDDFSSLVEQAIELCGEREDLISLREELAYREKKRQIEELVFRAEQARKDHDYQSALDTTQSVLAKVDDRFSACKTWAIEFQASTKAEWDQQLGIATRQVQEAKKFLEEGCAKQAYQAVESMIDIVLLPSQRKFRLQLKDLVAKENEIAAMVKQSNARSGSDLSSAISLYARAADYLKSNPGHTKIVKLKNDLITRLKNVQMSDLVKLPKSFLVQLPKDIQDEIAMFNRVGALKLIPSGKFLMGEGSGARRVTLTKPFFLGIYPVTQEQYERVMGKNPSHFKGPQKPVDNVSWKDAMEFCMRLSAFPKEQAAGRVYRLPTAAEWEYACRAGSKSKYCFGGDESRLGEYAWFEDNSGKTTHPVGQKKPNAWGLHDMHGNVWEWCNDWHGDYPKGAVTDPVGPQTGSFRVYRGGSWGPVAAYCRSASRSSVTPSYHSNDIGFRLALSSPEIPQ